MDISGYNDNDSVLYSSFNNSLTFNNNLIDAEDIIENKKLKSNENVPLDKAINELRTNIHDFVTKDWDSINEEIKNKGNHRTEEKQYDYSSEINNIDNIRIKIKKIYEEYTIIQRKLVSALNTNKQVYKKILNFKEFLDNYNEYNTDELNTNLLDLINKNNDDNNLRKLISEFVEKREELTQLLNAARIVQEMQVIPCCPLCLTAPLDSFVNPCGHTACKNCLLKSIQNPNENNSNFNCPICRKCISCINPLYIL